MGNAAAPALARRVKRQRDVAHTRTVSPEGPRPGLHNDLFRAQNDAVDTLPMPGRVKASEIGLKINNETK